MSENQFSPRFVNVLKISNLTDAEIFLRECDFALESIERQSKEPFFANDSEWCRDSKRATAEIIHKRELCLLKQAELQRKEALKIPGDSFSSRFVKAAKQVLPEDQFENLKAFAMNLAA